MKQRTVYALGFFDGVHLGHQALLRACKAIATEYSCQAGVVTFTDHPESLVLGKSPDRINSNQDREALLKSYGIDTVLSLPFDKALMQTHWTDFLSQLVDTGAAGFVCGEDFRFGAGGVGTAKKLAAFCESRKLPHAVIPDQTLDGIRVSSSHIRSLLESGETETALRFLGHPHVLTAEVIPGRGLGHTLGIPTANLDLPQGVLLPKPGVYACRAFAQGKPYLAVTNIGSRPTVGGHRVTIEPHLLDFEGDLYGEQLTLAFYRYLRPEQNFDSLEELKAQIKKDRAESRKVLENCLK